MGGDALEVWKTIMLAQAQQCFFEKAASDQLKPGVVARLAAQVAAPPLPTSPARLPCPHPHTHRERGRKGHAHTHTQKERERDAHTSHTHTPTQREREREREKERKLHAE